MTIAKARPINKSDLNKASLAEFLTFSKRWLPNFFAQSTTSSLLEKKHGPFLSANQRQMRKITMRKLREDFFWGGAVILWHLAGLWLTDTISLAVWEWCHPFRWINCCPTLTQLLEMVFDRDILKKYFHLFTEVWSVFVVINQRWQDIRSNAK